MSSVTFNREIKRVLRLRWLIWGILGLVYILVYFHRTSTAVVADKLMADFGVTATSLGSLGAMYFYVYTVMQIPAGALADSIGARKTVTAGAFLAGVGSLLFGFAPTLGVAYGGRFLVGLGVSVVFIAIMKIQSEWFRTREFGTLSGLTMFVGNLGAVLGATPLAVLVGMAGWRSSFEVIGVVSVIVAAASWLIIRNKPTELGLPSLPEIEAMESGGVLSASAETTVSLWRSMKITFGNKYTWPPFLVFFGLYGTLMAYSGMWGVPYLMQVYGMDRNVASTYMTAFAVGIMVGSPLVGLVSDKMKSRKMPFILFSAFYIALWLILAFWNGAKPPLIWLYPLNFFMGFFGSTFILTWACAKEVNPKESAGMATGTANLGGFLGAAIMQPLFGYALDHKWLGQIVKGVRIYPLEAYQVAFYVCLLALVATVIGLFLLKETECQNIYQTNSGSAFEASHDLKI